MNNQFYKEKSQIIAWLDKYKVSDYEIVADEQYGYKVNVEKDVYLNAKYFEFFPIKFGTINGNFNCNNNNLTSMEGTPDIVKGKFYCCYNQLTNLQFCPHEVAEFFCYANELENLEFCPEKVTRNYFSCEGNPHMGILQNKHDFNDIYAEHLKQRSAIELSNKLNNNLPENNVNISNAKRHKI